MYSELVWVLVSLGTQVQPQIILKSDYLTDYFSISYDHVVTYKLPLPKLLTKITCKKYSFC